MIARTPKPPIAITVWTSVLLVNVTREREGSPSPVDTGDQKPGCEQLLGNSLDLGSVQAVFGFTETYSNQLRQKGNFLEGSGPVSGV